MKGKATATAHKHNTCSALSFVVGITLILPVEELSMLLIVLLTQMMEVEVETNKLISEKLTKRDLHLSRWLGLD